MASNFLDRAYSQHQRVVLVPGESPEPFADEYRLLDLVGQGQFAQVYCAVHRRTGQLVAIKKTRHLSEQASQEPFVLNELCHPNIVCAQAIAQTPTGYQFVLDYCEAGTLRSQIDTVLSSSDNGVNDGAIARLQSPIRKLAEDILQGLSYIHSQAVIHGDLKPENILLAYLSRTSNAQTSRNSGDKTSRFTAKIGDFGSARFVELPSQSRREIGSPTYAAPERFEGRSSYASDLYSAGVILYELLLGDRPFFGSPDDLRKAHQHQAVAFPKSVPPAVQQFLEKALHKQPNSRFSSAKDMLNNFSALSNTVRESVSQTEASLASVSLNWVAPSQHVLAANAKKVESLIEQIPGKIEQLLSMPNGCFVVTDNAVYWINQQTELTSVAHFSQPVWSAISPEASWLMALEKQTQRPAHHQGQLVSLHGSLVTDSRAIIFQGQLLKTLQANVVQLLALDRRYLVRVLTSFDNARSFFECLTRKGQLVCDFPLNLSLSHAVSTPVPYQIAALSAATAENEDSAILLINLRPYQVRSLPLSTDLLSEPTGLSAFSWGFAAIDRKGCLFLDRSASPVGRLYLEGISAIAPFPIGKMLIARTLPSAFQTKGSSTKDRSVEPLSSLSVVDLKSLDLDLIF